MNITNLKDNYEILKEDKLSLNIEVLDINILYKTIVSLSIFEKFIIKIIDKAIKSNTSLLDISNEEQIINSKKIAEILSLDIEIVEDNIDKLSKSEFIEIKENKLIINWSENLKNWEKELIEEKSEKLLFKDKNSIESFSNLSIKERNNFLSKKYSKADSKREFYSFEVKNQEAKEIIIKTFFMLDKNNFELKILFEKDSQIFTLSDNITNLHDIQNLCSNELIVIEDNKIQNNIGIEFSKEQLDVINSKEKYILLKARAGSGKTAVITERTKRLLNQGIEQDETLLLAFNKKASKEMNTRVGNDFKNAKTFHSLAYSIAKPKENILQDKELLTFIQKNIQENSNEHLKKYLDIDSEIKDELEELRLNLSKKEFIKYIRENKTLTFKGLNIYSEHKSNGEKYISDFLFEHDIEFEYEKKFDWDGKEYKPDFFIFANTESSNPYIILEHWGIDENKKNGQVPTDWSKSWQEYKDEIKRKRAFWNNRDETFIETSISDFTYNKELKVGGQKAFNQRLKSLLEENGVKLRKLSDDEIYEKLEFQKILKITKQVEQYITNAKQAKLSPFIVQNRIEEFRKDKRTYYFLIFANSIFIRYEEEKYHENYIDFNDMLKRGIDKLQKNHVSKYKHIMIDEFQDFSPLFFDMIEKIRSYNPHVNILAVGDDWQGINGFAGANLKYFKNFKNYFESASERMMLTNYRSSHEIVDFSNKILEGENSKANKHGGEIFLNQNYSKKFVEDILNNNSDKTIAVLIRNNDEKEDIKGIIFETAHKSKGLEYDIVIIKDASKFEYLHPDNKLLEIFDKKEEDFIEENKRLFYVAVTRAKEKLYICGRNSFL